MDTKKINIGIIGNGFVGGTAYKAFSKVKGYNVMVYDKDITKARNTHFAVMQSEVIFVAVPTPMNADTGECITNIVEDVVADIRRYTQAWICIKSTVPPGTTERLHKKYTKVCFNPEFLTEVNAYDDFVSLPYQIFGWADKERSKALIDLYEEAARQGVMKCAVQIDSTATTAEMNKYVRNCYLASRVSFFNEMKQISDKLGIVFETVTSLAGLDGRVGSHYNRIDENEPEFSGSCFPKDVNGLIFFAKELGIDPKVLTAVWEKNLEVAKKRTWEQLPGRAFMKVSSQATKCEK